MFMYHNVKPMYVLLRFSGITVAVSDIQDANILVLVFSGRLSMKT